MEYNMTKLEHSSENNSFNHHIQKTEGRTKSLSEYFQSIGLLELEVNDCGETTEDVEINFISRPATTQEASETHDFEIDELKTSTHNVNDLPQSANSIDTAEPLSEIASCVSSSDIEEPKVYTSQQEVDDFVSIDLPDMNDLEETNKNMQTETVEENNHLASMTFVLDKYRSEMVRNFAHTTKCAPEDVVVTALDWYFETVEKE